VVRGSPQAFSNYFKHWRQAIACVDQALSRIGHVSNWRLIHTIMHHALYSIVSSNMIRNIRMPTDKGGHKVLCIHRWLWMDSYMNKGAFLNYSVQCVDPYNIPSGHSDQLHLNVYRVVLRLK